MQGKIRSLVGAAAIYNETINEDRLNGYLMALKSHSDTEVIEAIGIAIQECERFPTPAKIIEIVHRMGRARVYEYDQIEERELKANPEARTEVQRLINEFKDKMKWE